MSDDIAQAVQDSGGQPSTVRIGTVVSTNPIQIDLGGTILGLEALGFLTPYTPSVGDVVALLGQSVEGAQATGSSWLALGAIVAANTGLLGTAAFHTNGPAGTQVTNTGAYDDMTAVTFQFTKRRPGTRVLGIMLGSGFANANANGGLWGVAVGALGDFGLAKMFYNVLNQHGAICGLDILNNIPAGTYTIKGRFKRYVGAGGIVWNADDDISILLQEIN